MRVVPPSMIDPLRKMTLDKIRARVFGLSPPSASPSAQKILAQPLIGPRLNSWHYPDINPVEIAWRDPALSKLGLVDMDMERRIVREAHRTSRNSKIWNPGG
jgi:hypothetical protein